MKLLRILSLFAILPAFFVLAVSPSVHAQDEVECRAVIENFRANVETAPNHVLTLLEDALIANGGHCIPQFVQTAIETSKADAATVKKIVFVAITNAQAQAPKIAEAAVAASPKHADAVREAFADAFEDKNPRLKPADPANLPAWAQENAPVPAPKPATHPAPKLKPVPAPKPTPIPAPVPTPKAQGHDIPIIAASPGGSNPYTKIDDGSDAGWELLHDGVVDPIDPATLAASQGNQETGSETAPPAVEPELPEMKKKRFSFAMPKLPSLPALPEAEEPIDLFFHSPFGGVPPISQGS